MKRHLLVFPYQVLKGYFIIKSLKILETLLLEKIKPGEAFQGKQLSSCFNIKDKIEFPQKHDVVYRAEIPLKKCNNDYVGETARHISEKVIDHSGRDKNSKTPNRKQLPY